MKKLILIFLMTFLTFFGFNFSFVQVLADSQDIFISEISFVGSKSPNNCKKILENSDNYTSLCGFDKWIELYNGSENTINLENWRIKVQNGLSQKLSGKIAAKSFLVLSNGGYNYQSRLKITETWQPKIAEKNSQKSSTNSQINSENSISNFSNSSHNKSSLVFSSANSNFSNSNSNLNSSISNSNSNLNPNSANSQNLLLPNNSKNISNFINSSVSPLNSDQKSYQNNLNLENSENSSEANLQNNSVKNNFQNQSQTENQIEIPISANNSEISNYLKPILDLKKSESLTIEPKSSKIKIQNQTKIPNLKIEKLNSEIENSNSENNLTNSNQIYLQIDKNQLNQTQKDFILDNFKGLWRTQNNKYEFLNSEISGEQKQSLVDQKITWKLEKQTTFHLNSVLDQAGFANNSLGILHSISPTNPNVVLTNPNGQVVSQRSFGATNQAENRFTMEFESMESRGEIATNMYFPQNFGTPGFGKIQKTPKTLPVISPNNPKIPNQTGNLQTEKQPENAKNTQEISQKIVENVENLAQNLAKNLNSETKIINQNVALGNAKNLQTNLGLSVNPEFFKNPNLAPKVQQIQVKIQAENQLEKTEVSKNSSKITNKVENPTLEKKLENSKILENSSLGNLENSNLVNSKISLVQNQQNQLWNLHLDTRIPQEKLENNHQLSLKSLEKNLKNANTTKDNQREKIDNGINSNQKVQNLVKINLKDQNFVFSQTSTEIFNFQNNSFLNFWVNLLLLLLALKKQDSKKPKTIPGKTSAHFLVQISKLKSTFSFTKNQSKNFLQFSKIYISK